METEALLLIAKDDLWGEEDILGEGMVVLSEVDETEEGELADESMEETTNLDDTDGESEIRNRNKRQDTKEEDRHFKTVWVHHKLVPPSKVERLNPFSAASEEQTLHVQGLPVTTTWSQIFDHFKSIGPITLIRLRTHTDEPLLDRQQAVQYDPHINSYIIFTYKWSVPKALSITSLTDFHGQKIQLSRAVHKIMNRKRAVCVANMATQTTEQDLRDLFGRLGKINSIWFEIGRKGDAVAYVSFINIEAVDRAMKLQGTRIHGQSIFLESGEDQWKFDKEKRLQEIKARKQLEVIDNEESKVKKSKYDSEKLRWPKKDALTVKPSYRRTKRL